MASSRSARVVLVIIDALPHRHVGADVTPNLWHQAQSGGRAPTGGRSTPVSVTYANHAALITGQPPSATGIHGNHAWDDESWVSAPAAGPRALTLIDAVASAGLRSAFLAGDHQLVHQMGGDRADVHWPPDGRIPTDAPRCEFRYATDRAVLDALDRLGDTAVDADLLVVHLNEPDTAAHLHGPDADAALERYRSTDAIFGELVERLRPRWDETLLIAVSDHDQETIDDQIEMDGVRRGVDLVAQLADVEGASVAHEGTAALVHVAAGADVDEARRSAQRIAGIEGTEPLDCNDTGTVFMAWTEPRRSFGTMPIDLRGQHGSPRCRTQVAVVSGGHAVVPHVAERIAARPPSVLDWAPMIRSTLQAGGR